MEEKKRRPRIQRPGQEEPLKERPSSTNSGDENDHRDYNREQKPYDRERKPWQNRDKPYDRERRPYDPDRKPYDRERRPYDPDRKPYDRERRPYDPDRKPYDRERRPYDPDRKPHDRERRPYDPDRKPWQNREGGGGGGGYRKPYDRSGGGYGKKPFGKKPFRKKEEFHVEKLPKPELPSGVDMPLNKYLAHCGLASRRKAVEFIEKGLVQVNGEVKLEPYYRVLEGDIVTYEGKEVKVQERTIYVLLNKPKGVITTTEDDRGRPTVLDIVDPHFPERIYPVGRLDRDTTGLLLITNDGDLAAKLTHPSQEIPKHYRIGIDKPLSPADFTRIEQGVELEDGVLHVNWIRFSEEQPNRDVIELEITEGRNRVIRRLFEALGYRVRKLDRFYFAGLTKRELQRGSFRELTQREISMLKELTAKPPASEISES